MRRIPYGGQTPLHKAAERGHLSVCQSILKYSKELLDNVDYTGYTPLHYAAENGHFEVCRFFIRSMEDKNPETCNGLTPLNCAVRYRHFKVCKLIIDNLDDKNPRSRNAFFGCWTPLEVAEKYGHTEIETYIKSPIYVPMHCRLK